MMGSAETSAIEETDEARWVQEMPIMEETPTFEQQQADALALVAETVLHRDKECRFPGCGLPFGQGHHIRHWAHGGPTTLSNLALLCRRHHRAVHEEGYQVDREPDGTLTFRRPDGEVLPAVPWPAMLPADPVEILRKRHDEQGLHVDAHSLTPSWLGESLNVGWAIDVLHPLAAG